MTNRKIEDNLGLLSDLQSFDKNAFIGDDKFSQELCNLILAFGQNNEQLKPLRNIIRVH
jgi:hypothetical protein